MGTIASHITSLTIVYSTVYSGADQRKHQSPASLAFVRGIHRGPVNSPHKWPVMRKMFPFNDVIMRRPHSLPGREASAPLQIQSMIYVCISLCIQYRPIIDRVITIPVGWFSINTSFDQYRDTHYKDVTVVRPSYLYNGNSYIDNATSLYWTDPLTTKSIFNGHDQHHGNFTARL